MTNYRRIEDECIKQNELSKTLLDDFLIYYCTKRERIDKGVAKKLGHYRSIIQDMPEEWPFWFMSQYAAFRLFQKNGFARKYENHPAILSRSDDEKAFLSFQTEHPWRYSFCSVKGNPAHHFFEMADVLTSKEFLLYSPGLTEIVKQHGPIRMLFFLLGFNGLCWQTYGPHAYFRGLLASDLLFFAQQLNPNVVFMDQIPELINRDPIPWALLWKNGEIPLTFHKDDMVILNCSEYHEENFEPDEYGHSFKIERKYPLYKLSLKRWDRFPHFACCYYHKKKNRLIISALTDRGYAKLSEALGMIGYDLPESPEKRVTLAMLQTVKEILGKDIQLNPYEKSFEEPVKQEDPQELEKINKFLRFLMDAHNTGQKIDIDKFASSAGIDSETAQRFAEQVMKKINRMPGKRN